LTIQEEAQLRKKIAEGKTNLSVMNQTQKNKLFKTCQFYLQKSEEKLDFMKLEAQNEFTKIIENGYSTTEWQNKLDDIKSLVTSAKGRPVSELNNLTTDISGIFIPNSLAAIRFRDLQLVGFFLDMIDLLGLTLLVNGHTPAEAIIASATVNAIIEADHNSLNQNGYSDDLLNYHGCDTTDEDCVKKCIRVMLGLFGIQSGTASADHWYSDNDDFEKGWQKIIRRLKWVFGNSKAPRAVLLEYNSYNGLGVDMDAGYATSCTEEKNDSQDLQVQYDHIE